MVWFNTDTLLSVHFTFIIFGVLLVSGLILDAHKYLLLFLGVQDKGALKVFSGVL